jgi:hypothetical protein
MLAPSARRSAVPLALALTAIVLGLIVAALWYGAQHRAISPNGPPANGAEPSIVTFWPEANGTADGLGGWSVAITYAAAGLIAGDLQFRYANVSGALLPEVTELTLVSEGGTTLGEFNSSLSNWSGGNGWSPVGMGWLSGANASIHPGDSLFFLGGANATELVEGYELGSVAGSYTSAIG